MTDAGAFIRNLRAQHNLTQRELAERAYTRQSNISRIESGAHSPTIRSLTLLVEAVGEKLVLARG